MARKKYTKPISKVDRIWYLFERFLKEYDLFSRFCYDVKVQHENTKNLYYIKRNYSTEPWEYINQSICWSETPEGHEFWQKVDLAWRTILKHITKECIEGCSGTIDDIARIPIAGNLYGFKTINFGEKPLEEIDDFSRWIQTQ